MEKIRIVHSFWTKPMIEDKERWNSTKNQIVDNVYIITLSSIYAKLHPEIHLVLYTDDLGYKLLSHLEYDEIHKDLEDIPIDSVSKVIWAQCKFYAMKNEPLGSIHTDYDVFIKKKECVEELKEIKNYDLIVQDIELSDGFVYDDCRMILNNIGIDVNERYAYNCGVIGFNNQELKDKYYDLYFKYSDIIRKEYENNNIGWNGYDLTIEQENLFAISKNYNVKNILPIKYRDNESYSKYQQKAIDIGYQHLIGHGKYLKSRINKVKEFIKCYDENLFNLTKQKIEEYERGE